MMVEGCLDLDRLLPKLTYMSLFIVSKDDLITFVDAKSFKSRHDEQFKFEVSNK